MEKIQRSSELLVQIAEDKALSDTLTLNKFLQRLGNRAFGIALLLFSLPNLLPTSIVPGVSFIFGLPIAIIALEFIFTNQFWLPKAIGDKKISHEKISKIIYTAMPHLIKAEKVLKPRFKFMNNPVMKIINSLAIFILGLLLMLPIPFSNFALGGLIIIFSLGFIENDGLFIIIGYVGAIFYIYIVYFIILAALKALF